MKKYMKMRIRVDLKIHIAKMKTFLFSILIVFGSCNGQKKAVVENENSTDIPTNTPLTLLMGEEYSGLSEAETLVITDAKTLKSFFSKINRTRKPGITVPNIDFSKEMVIIACSGEQMSGGSASILYVLEETDSKMVLSTKPENKEKGLGTSAITSPFRMYTMPVTDKEIAIEKNK